MHSMFQIEMESHSKVDVFRKCNDIFYNHFHSNIEIAYVVEGSINISINGESKTLTKGCISIANSYDIHSYETVSTSKTIVLIIPTSFVNSYINLLSNKIFISPFMNSCPESHQIYYALNKLIEIKNSENFILQKGYLYFILGIIVNNIGLTNKPKLGNIDLIRNILLYIHENYLIDLKIKDIALKFGYNKDYISRCFNQYLGCGFNDYLNSIRLKHALMLMQDQEMTLTNISFESGFNNYRTFNKVFQSAYKITPTEYKQSS